MNSLRDRHGSPAPAAKEITFYCTLIFLWYIYNTAYLAARYFTGYIVYQASYFLAGFSLLYSISTECWAINGGIDDPYPERLSFSAHLFHYACRGRHAGFEQRGNFQQLLLICFALIAFVCYFVYELRNSLGRFMIRLGMPLIDKRPVEICKEDQDNVIDIAFAQGVGLAQAERQETINILEAKLYNLEKKAQLCAEKHNNELAMKNLALQAEVTGFETKVRNAQAKLHHMTREYESMRQLYWSIRPDYDILKASDVAYLRQRNQKLEDANDDLRGKNGFEDAMKIEKRVELLEKKNKELIKQLRKERDERELSHKKSDEKHHAEVISGIKHLQEVNIKATLVEKELAKAKRDNEKLKKELDEKELAFQQQVPNHEKQDIEQKAAELANARQIIEDLQNQYCQIQLAAQEATQKHSGEISTIRMEAETTRQQQQSALKQAKADMAAAELRIHEKEQESESLREWRNRVETEFAVTVDQRVAELMVNAVSECNKLTEKLEQSFKKVGDLEDRLKNAAKEKKNLKAELEISSKRLKEFNVAIDLSRKELDAVPLPKNTAEDDQGNVDATIAKIKLIDFTGSEWL